MSANEEIADAVATVHALRALEGAAGFSLICARFDDEIRQIEEKVFDSQTSDEDAAVLRRVRAKLVENHPGTVLKQLKVKFTNRASRPGNKESQ
jgi:hypothetical protein